jgi:hypothetical protein
MQEHLAIAFKEACAVWEYRIEHYLCATPGDICVPTEPLHEATEFAILALDHFLPRETYVKIADGLAIAAFHEVLRVSTKGRPEDFSVMKDLRARADTPGHLALESSPDPVTAAAWTKAVEVAQERWYELLPRGLPMAEYEVYRFHKMRDRILDDATAEQAAQSGVAPADAANLALTATNAAFYAAVAAMECDV